MLRSVASGGAVATVGVAAGRTGTEDDTQGGQQKAIIPEQQQYGPPVTGFFVHIGAAVAASVPPVRGWASWPPWQGCWVVDGLPTAAATDAGKTTLVTPSVVYGVEMSGKDEYYNYFSRSVVPTN